MINHIILANGKSDYHMAMTQLCIESIVASKRPATNGLDTSRIVVVESLNHPVYNKVDVMLRYDCTKYKQFNYNYALNQGINYCQRSFQDNDWWCFMNNDVVVQPNWLLEIEKAVKSDPQLDSICPNINKMECGIKYGYTVWKHLNGCCILCKDVVLQKIGLFDEEFYFYFQDDDYLEQLRLHNIKHGKVMSSLITHLGSQTLPEDDSSRPLLFYCRDVFIKKYTLQTYIQREMEKRSQS